EMGEMYGYEAGVPGIETDSMPGPGVIEEGGETGSVSSTEDLSGTAHSGHHGAEERYIEEERYMAEERRAEERYVAEEERYMEERYAQEQRYEAEMQQYGSSGEATSPLDPSAAGASPAVQEEEAMMIEHSAENSFQNSMAQAQSFDNIINNG